MSPQQILQAVFNNSAVSPSANNTSTLSPQERILAILNESVDGLLAVAGISLYFTKSPAGVNTGIFQTVLTNSKPQHTSFWHGVL